MNFRVFDDRDALVRGTADAILDTIESEQARVIALSGGSTPRPVYEMLGSEPLRRRLAAVPLIWVTGDERDVPPDHPESNAGMIRSTLFRHGIPEGQVFLTFDTRRDGRDSVVEEFEAEWRKLGIEGLDLAIQGIGEDGHTASLFPGTTILEAIDRIAASVWVPKVSMWRFSLTAPVIGSAKKKLFLAAGKGKREILTRIRAGEEFPSTVVTRFGGPAWWLVDRDAYPE
ncbi:MAG: 6-phosphogluconolactonase [Thermoanaerobaculia bacterium]